MRVTRIHGRFSLEEYKKIGYSFSVICLVRPWIHTHASVYGAFGSYFAPFLHVGGLPEMTSGKSFVFSALLGSTAILALRQFTEAVKMFTLSRRAGGLWTLCLSCLRSVQTSLENVFAQRYCFDSGHQFAFVCCRFSHIFHVKADFAQPFIAAIITPVIQCCTGGLDMDECEQSWAQIPCQFQACLRQERLLVVRTVISNLEAVPGCVVFGRVAGVDGGKSVGHAMSG